MLLALDIGNTNVTVGAFEGRRLVRMWRLATDLKKTSDEYGVSLTAMLPKGPGGRVQSVILGSVVPALSPVFDAASQAYLGVKALVVTYASRLGIRLKVDHPAQVGVDRILNALAVHRLHGGPAVVIDFGTATTFDCVSARGDYLGGAILIGPKVAAQALAEHTAQLPQVEIRRPGKVIGTNTVECIQAGLYHGYLGMVQKVLEETLREMRAPSRSRTSLSRTGRSGSALDRASRIRVVATGGLAGLFAREIPKVKTVAPDLTLQGLRLAHEILAPRSEKNP